jgi:hypothetical protein
MSAVLDRPAVRWDGIQWPGASVVILASGQSLTVDQCEAVRAWRETGDQRRVIVINTTFRRAPWADVLYACDAPWWMVHRNELDGFFKGERWSLDEKAAVYGARLVRSERRPGLGRTPGVIHQGGNSGYQAVNLAYQAGATRILLLGFDMHGTHWHGRYQTGLPNTSPHLFDIWLAAFKVLAKDLAKEDVVVRNCTVGGRLDCFERSTLEKELA